MKSQAHNELVSSENNTSHLLFKARNCTAAASRHRAIMLNQDILCYADTGGDIPGETVPRQREYGQLLKIAKGRR